MEITDIVALIRSWTTMYEQLTSRRVNRGWNRMVSDHPALLQEIYVGNPHTFTYTPLRVIKQAGSRIRRLIIAKHNYDIVEIFQTPLRVHLEYLEIWGHVDIQEARVWRRIMNSSKAIHITVRIASCSCCMDLLEELLVNPKVTNMRTTVTLQSPLSFKSSRPCDRCATRNAWTRRCPGCNSFQCSRCTNSWWHKYPARQCLCHFCLSNPFSLSRWNCSQHCNLCFTLSQPDQIR